MGWDELNRWPEPPTGVPAEIVAFYLSQVHEQVPSVRKVWAETRGHTLWIATLIPRDREAERRLHAVELAIMRKWPGVPIEFRIYREGEWLPPALTNGNLPVFAT
jgi:hypothetical protein